MFDIVYETDGAKIDLPQDLLLELDDQDDPEECLEDGISDKTGWCVQSFCFEAMEMPTLQLSLKI